MESALLSPPSPRRPHDRNVLSAASEKGRATTVSGKLRLLLVEDDFATLQALRLLLSRAGWNVEVASTLAQALRRLESCPDWLVIDLMLPDGDGTALLKKVRDENMDVRVAVITASSDSARLRIVNELKPDLVLIKPIDLDVLFKALRRE